MKDNDSHSLEESLLIGKAMKRIRQLKSHKTLWVATQLGYKEESTYCRMERGEINVYESKVRKFCKLFDCNIVHFYQLAGIDIFETKIKTWTEFYKSLSDLTEEEAAKLMEIANQINPPPYKINRLIKHLMIKSANQLFL